MKIKHSQKLGPIEYHPYGVFLPNRIKVMLIGSFPIGKFSDPHRRYTMNAKDIDFFYGGSTNQLWKIVGQIFNVKLNDKSSIEKLLNQRGIAIADVIKSCRRINGGGLDSQLKEICWHTELAQIIRQHQIPKLVFTSDRVRQWFIKNIDANPAAECMTVISPSAGGLRAFTKEYELLYQKWLQKNPRATRGEFRIEIFRRAFN